MAVSVAGLPELNAAFKSLGDKVSKKTGLRMVAAAAGVVRNQAKTNVRALGLVKSGALLRNIAIKRERNVPRDTVQYHVGVRHGRNLRKNVINNGALKLRKGRIVIRDDPYYWSFLEFGRSTYKGVKNSAKLSRRTKSQYATGSVQATPFLAPAFEQRRQEAIQKMRDVIDKELLK